MRVIVESDNLNEARLLVSAAIQHELKILRIGINKTKENIKNFENTYNISTESFYKKYTAGAISDGYQYIRWAGEYETLLKLQKDYKEIEGAEVC